MCAPKMPKPEKTKEVEIATPTLADAEVTKASEKTKLNAAKQANQDIKTSARGLGEEATTKKKNLLGE
jgi:hypothetical protein